jgi:arylsulfatase A-like enzyme
MLLGALGLSMPKGAWGKSHQSGMSRPNILFIMSDDHATNAIGAYGGRLAVLDPTPRLDSLASSGTLFENALVTNSICTPSRATILTGQYSHTNGVLDLDGALDPARQLLPMLLRDAGYFTALIGKWHLRKEPAAFDHYAILPDQGRYRDPSFLIRGPRPFPENIVTSKGHSTDVITDMAIAWLEGQRGGQPFCLMLQYKAPHAPFDFAPRYVNYLRDVEVPEPISLYDQVGWGSVATRGPNDTLRHAIGSSVSRRNLPRSLGVTLGIPPDLPEREFTHRAYQEYLKRYLRCVRGIDDNLGRLFDYLNGSGQAQSTVIIYTSDQGMLLGEHDLQDKRWIYEESLRMPLIIRDPRNRNAPSRVSALINNTDFAPTLLDLAGAAPSPQMQGRSFLGFLNGASPRDWRSASYYRYWMHRVHHDVPAHFGIRSDRHKLIFFYGIHYGQPDLKENPPRIFDGDSAPRWAIPTTAGWEFYDLSIDPEERVNRYSDPRYREIIVAMKRELALQRQQVGDTDSDYPTIRAIVEKFWND